jgi:hypothetical protein
MQGNSEQGKYSKRCPDKSRRLEAPLCVHVYVWLFMISLGVSPMLCLLAAGDGLEPGHALASVQLVGLVQATLWIAQRRCSSDDLSYWEGLLAAAASVTTGQNLISLLRTFPLLLAVVILSVGFALDHDGTSAERHAQLRFAKLIIWAHKQRLWR